MTAMSAQQDLQAGLPRVWRHVHNGDIVHQRSHGLAVADIHHSHVAAGTAALSDLTIVTHELSDDAIESD